MNAPRMIAIPESQFSPEQRRVADALIAGPRGAVRGPFPALLRNAELADCTRALGDCVRSSNTLPLAVREIAVLIVARHWNASYEWGAHVKIAREIGLDDSIVADIKAGRRPVQAEPGDALVYDFCVAVLRAEDVGDRMYDAMVTLCGERGVVDLIGVLGYASFACMVFNVARVPTASPENDLRLHQQSPRQN